MAAKLNDVTGSRGENIVELRLTDYVPNAPLFAPGFLGDKWPTIDFYVELRRARGKTPFFFVQAKTTSAKLVRSAKSLKISTTKEDIKRLLRIPGPTYIFGVHEPSRRVFVRSVHLGIETKAMTTISIANELTNERLKALHREVREFWKGDGHKPISSVFG